MNKMECQLDKTEHFRHDLLLTFNPYVKAIETARKIRALYGERAMSQSTTRR